MTYPLAEWPKRILNRLRRMFWWIRGVRDGTDHSRTWDDLIEDRAIQTAEEDRLSHHPLSRQVAEIAASGASPTAIGLFGPWGSGKSGLLRLIRAELVSANIPVVAIDAWKYGEKPLSRQFVTEAASQLAEQRVGIWSNAPSALKRWRGRRARQKVWGQLYESRRRRRIRFRSMPASLFGLLLAAGFFVLVLVLTPLVTEGLGLVGPDEPSSSEVSSSSELPLFSAAILTAVVSFALAALTVESDLNRPDSEEEFERVLTEAVRSGSRGRVVFLVDELDRSPPDEVMATLRTIRTFFEVPDTSFVVAADRDVIETALADSPDQVYPRFPENTYSGFAGSFLDKLFQVQIPLPPVRERRLTHMAVRLVQEKADNSPNSIWASIDDIGEVVSVLLPTHVRSPRRLKVLLNSFATALRIALIRRELGMREAVDVHGLDRQLALAKLVCLRTEFPLFARHLPDHPRLTEALSKYVQIEYGPDPAVDKARKHEDLLGNYPGAVGELVREYATHSLPVEEPLGADTEGVEDDSGSIATEPTPQRELEKRRTDELLRYLSKTADSPHPSRDLIYGTSLGDVFDLDSEAAASLEAAALDARKQDVAAIVEGLEQHEQVAAVRLLAYLAAKEIGIDRTNAMVTLLQVINEIDQGIDLSPATPQLAEAWRANKASETSEDQWSEQLLGLSRWLPDVEAEQLQIQVLESADWREDEQRVQRVLGTAEWWEAGVSVQMRDVVNDLLSQLFQTTLQALESLPPAVLASLWSPGAWSAVGAQAEDAATFHHVAEKLSEAERAAGWKGVEILLADGYEEFALEIATVLGGPQTDVEVSGVLNAWVDGLVDPERVPSWVPVLKTSVSADSLQEVVTRVVRTIAKGVLSGDLSPAEGIVAFQALRNIGLKPSDDPSMLEGLGVGWWRNAGSVSGMRVLDELLTDVVDIWPTTRVTVQDYRSTSVVEAFASGEALADEASDFVVDEVGGGLQFDRSERDLIRGRLTVLGLGRQEFVYAHIWRMDREDGSQQGFEVLDQVVTNTSPLHDRAFAIWIYTALPPVAEVWRALLAVGRQRWKAPITDATARYLERSQRNQATALVRRMIRENSVDTSPLLEAIPVNSINQTAAARELAQVLRDASNTNERRRALRRMAALNLTAHGARTELVDALDAKRLESTTAAADILGAFPYSIVTGPGGPTLLKNLKAQAKKAKREDLERKIRRIIGHARSNQQR